MDMPDEPQMLPKSRMNDAIRAAFEAGKAAERFYDRSGLSNRGRTPEGSTNTAGHGQKPDWHH